MNQLKTHYIKALLDLHRGTQNRNEKDLVLRAEAQLEDLITEIDDGNDYYRRVVMEQCAPDELHCTCVPGLRKEIDKLNTMIDLMLTDAVVVTYGEMGDTDLLGKRLGELRKFYERKI